MERKKAPVPAAAIIKKKTMEKIRNRRLIEICLAEFSFTSYIPWFETGFLFFMPYAMTAKNNIR
jgi:hypothetical protein